MFLLQQYIMFVRPYDSPSVSFVMYQFRTEIGMFIALTIQNLSNGQELVDECKYTILSLPMPRKV